VSSIGGRPPRPVGHARPRVDRRAAVVLALLVAGPPLLLALGSALLADRLPAELARHWTGDRVTGTWSRTTGLVAGPLVGTLVSVAIAVPAVLTRISTAVRRSLAATAAWTATFVATVGAGVLVGHLDLAEGTAAHPPDAAAAIGALVGVPAAVAAAVAVRAPATERTPATSPPPDAAPRLPPGTAPTPWTGRPPISRGVTLGAVGCVAVVVALAPLAGWWLLVLAALVAAVALGTLRAYAVVDADGLVVTATGVRLLGVPIDEVAEAGVADLDPWAFGGWGLRVDPHGRTAVVTRAGEALRVRRADGGEVFVTVDDAATAAATLNSYADRR
jgi:hypothetical protein